MADRRVSIETDEETRRKLKILAAEAELTIKEFLRSLVEREWALFHVKQS